MAVAGISTLGVVLGYGVETTKGTRPTAFKTLSRINDLPGLNLETEQIDASALEDLVSRYIPGRQDTGGTMAISINVSDDTIKEWEDAITAYNGLKDGKSMWFTIVSPNLKQSFDFTGAPPQKFPIPAMGQNGLMTVEMSIVVDEYKGLQTKIVPTVGE